MASETNTQVAIVGAGLCGSLLAIFLAKRGLQVTVYEKRADMRKVQQGGGRSINLALSHRGIKALQQVGIADAVLEQAIPMFGRLLHNSDGELTFVPYGKDKSEYINSISRSGLNIQLMNIAEREAQVTFCFEKACKRVDLEAGKLHFASEDGNEEIVQAEVIFGTDGAGSVIRQSMEAREGFSAQSEFLEYSYKELSIPAHRTGGFQIEKNALHIWPRGSYMLIALPNLDGSFTCTLFLANAGKDSFASLERPEDVQAFFEKNFSDTRSLMPDLLQDYQDNPTGLLGTVRCYPWSVNDKALILGDAAHAIVPFYGQGMNASFEDCRMLDACIEKYGQDWGQVFRHFEKLRKENTDAIATLAIENFYEMRDDVADEDFLKVRRLEFLLENQFADYHSKYSLVTFHPDISYAEAHQRGNRQNELLLELCAQTEDIASLNLDKVYQLLKEKVHF